MKRKRISGPSDSQLEHLYRMYHRTELTPAGYLFFGIDMRTFHALIRKGWATEIGNFSLKITDEGKAVLEENMEKAAKLNHG